MKINDKGSFKRYKEFFERFEVDVARITDLDILLNDFDKIEPTKKATELRDQLLKDVDRIIVCCCKIALSRGNPRFGLSGQLND